ncbi:hypothetical protein CEY16_03380 [Halalkalibacillus sediminis]|uniref:Isoprenylcysteine carboxyl methyltransferase n=1 Tax=Halalkalibacillus sediminis TaxID=2018042 RepID=A0A2I0QWX4_9BACI|nr:isoprenylcysteine carboxylmethyltransferase family protein [Halalkalibacillus sediminis]PKR78809.1 hypothetical protein CEY16_03380 [Halalkalibacillus sediminis]
MLIWILFYLILLRVGELIVAKSNERFQLQRGGILIPDPWYPLIVMTHVFFFIFLIAEWLYMGEGLFSSPSLILGFTFIFLQILRFWTLLTLGRRWNTKVIIRPSEPLVQKGPFKWISHPNYWIVFGEFIVIPLMFGAYITAIIFPIAHILLMTKRIPLEEKSLNFDQVRKGESI